MLLGLYTDFSGRRGKVAWYWPTLSEALAYFIEAEVDAFLCDQTNVGNSISGSSAFSKPSLNIWKFMVHILLKPRLENFKHYFTSMWSVFYCVVVWTFYGVALLWDWNKNWPFPVLWPLLSCRICWEIECSILTASLLRIWNSSAGMQK